MLLRVMSTSRAPPQEVTDEIGRHAPHRRDEVERNTSQIQTKLVLAMRELASLTDEIALGCDTCQAKNET